MAKWQLLTSEDKHVRELVRKTEEDLINTSIQQWVYQKEYMSPQHIGKNEAHEKVKMYMKRIEFIEENLEVYKLYAQLKGYEL